jgi:hypothetical protein
MTAATVQIVGPADGWILEALARRLASKLPYATFAPWRPRPSPGGLAYYVNYALYQGPGGGVDVGFFTHVDEGQGFLERARRMDFCVSMSVLYAGWLRDRGVPHVAHVPMGFDYYGFRPRLVLGVVGRLEHPRKGAQLVERLRRLDFVEIVATEGRIPADALREVYQRVDYVLVPGTVEGGPMSLLEGLGSGKPVIAPAGVGIAPEFADSRRVLFYPAGDAEALAGLAAACHREKLDRCRAVRGRTWDDWAESHHALFDGLLRGRGLALPRPAEGFRFGLMGEADVPFDVDVAALEAVVDRASRSLYFDGPGAARRVLDEALPRFPCLASLAARL